MSKKLAVIIGIIIVSAFIGYLLKTDISEQTNPQQSGNKLQIVTSFYPLYYFATQIGGDRAEVRNITPSGAEPHDYDPSTQDIAKIENSNMLIVNGGVEAWG